MSASQLLPINQINAMPVQTIAGVVNGTVYTLGGRVSRYFSPADLELNGVNLVSFPTGGANPVWYQASNRLSGLYLNLLGCTVFTLLIIKTYGTYLGAGQALTVFTQTRRGPTDAPDPFFIVPATHLPDDNLAGKVNTYTAGTNFVAAAAAGEVQRTILSWGGTIRASLGQQNALGLDTRIVLSYAPQSARDPWGDPAGVQASATLTVAMWAA